MDFITNKKNQSILIVSLLILFMIIALALRMIPALFIQDQGFFSSNGADVWYTLRQVEVMVADFPAYYWFDPMTAYPAGKSIDWGPLYPFLASVLCLAFGASTRADIVYIAGWVSPIMAAIMVPVTYRLGKLIRDWKTGLVAAGLVSILSYGYFCQSSYGWVDHHIAETFFTTLFFLAYISALLFIRENPVDLKNVKTLVTPVLLSVLAGALYFLGYLTSPTALIALLVVGIYTFIQYIADFTSGQRSDYLLLVNILSFSCIALLETLFGFRQVGLSLTVYSAGHVFVMLGLIAETVLFYGFTRIFHRNRVHYFLSLAGIVVGGVALVQVLPALQTIKDQAVSLVWSGFSVYSTTVRETIPWTFSAAYETFNLALLLMAGGLVILIWYLVRNRRNEHIFLITWFAVTFLMTIPHQRFQLYLTVPVALLAAICITGTVRWSWDPAGAMFSAWISRVSGHHASGKATETVARKERKTKKPAHVSGAGMQPLAILKHVILIVVIIITIVVVATSLGQDIKYVIGTPGNQISGDWIETMEWLKTSTPSPMVDYFQKYDRQTFTYPNASYGIMAPWENGHKITFFSHRIPITNPFQNNLGGNDGAAAFFLSGSEESADKILTTFKGRYVITDLGTATDTFPALIPWVNYTEEISPYIYWFFIQDTTSPSGLTKTHLLGDAYFQSMIVRLQVFDGSMVLPDTAQYTRYTIRKVPDSGTTAEVGGLARVITGTQTVNVSLEQMTTSPEGSILTPGATYADIYSSVPYQPIKKVPALTHYRLVHESPTNLSVQLFGSATGSPLPDIRLVKVFEYVSGAHIPGDGVIELPLVTNTGRTFVYRQESSGGEFIVPYATEGSAADVRATGPYHIIGTTRYVTVTETDVQNGNTITGSG
ncbi:MAG: oligosaccharyl transferase, archaeosortase A system-associated [Methanoregula sp.]|uniref:oligosaccharyl transferase, archaeosortase A system-associated n=1 Tax=Methanoregula sp. TaxID=2052170 RepID=UPI0025CC2227|nr:oligosaccharyl transferase, archaeosortase A system-associated [Methanoregula sp.]MCK9631744.1 oligosaccharyl transferase, archaeosortase A system-associated [Methanoregula sp.]